MLAIARRPRTRRASNKSKVPHGKPTRCVASRVKTVPNFFPQPLKLFIPFHILPPPRKLWACHSHVCVKSPSGQLRPPGFNVVRIGRRTSGIQRPHEGFAATQIHQALGSGFFCDNVLVEASEAAIYNVLRDTVDPVTGTARKCYVVTRDDIRHGESLEIDPATGRECRPVTAEVIERLRAYKWGNRPRRIESTDPIFFSLRTGEPIVWYHKDENDEIQLFDLMGFDPGTGDELGADSQGDGCPLEGSGKKAKRRRRP